jgi:hypothetical protein
VKGKIGVGKSQLKGLLVLLAALFVAAFSGCTPKSTPPGADTAGGTLEGASYVFLQWKEGLAILIWHDLSYGATGCGGTGSTSDPVYRLDCTAESQEGRRIVWEVQTPDGQTAQFEIDDTGYDLSDGALFLIATADGKTDVRQLQRDLSGVQPNRESIVAFAKSDPDVAKFAGVRPNSQ